MRIGLYGGSFDPVHNGHLGVARAALDDLGLDRLLVLPAAVSPFKTDEPPAGLYDRLLLLRAAFCGWERVVIDERELVRGGVSYAIDTVSEIAVENSGAELFFIVGEDSVAGLPRWKDYAKLVTLCTFKSYPRTRESSTEIRERLRRGEAISDLVPDSVDLLLRHGVRYNEDDKIVSVVLDGLARKGGFCPCRLPKLPEFRCPCTEFREQCANPAFSGLCHCRLYRKG